VSQVRHISPHTFYLDESYGKTVAAHLDHTHRRKSKDPSYTHNQQGNICYCNYQIHEEKGKSLRKIPKRVSFSSARVYQNDRTNENTYSMCPIHSLCN